MSDPTPNLNAEDGAPPATPQRVIPPPAYGQGRKAPQSKGNPAPVRMPLFRR
jgi:hypothetical protein